MTAYTLPRMGQIFQQKHDNGNRIKYGSVIGLEVTHGTDGAVLSWRAVIQSGFHSNFQIGSQQGWRVASEWHAVPETDAVAEAILPDVVPEPVPKAAPTPAATAKRAFSKA